MTEVIRNIMAIAKSDETRALQIEKEIDCVFPINYSEISDRRFRSTVKLAIESLDQN